MNTQIDFIEMLLQFLQERKLTPNEIMFSICGVISDETFPATKDSH